MHLTGDSRKLSADASVGLEPCSGEAFTGRVGIDTWIGKSAACIAASISESDAGYGEGTVAINVELTGLHPYFGLAAPDGSLFLHLAGSYEQGEVGVGSDSTDSDALQTSYFTFGANGRRKLYSSESIILGSGTTSFHLTGRTWMARQSVEGNGNHLDRLEVRGGHLRLAVEGSHKVGFENGITVKPSASVGMRGDAKGNSTRNGFEITSGFAYQDIAGFTVSKTFCTLLSKTNQLNRWALGHSEIRQQRRQSLCADRHRAVLGMGTDTGRIGQ